jgi:glycosyltransferase involved in cell wall biosynthesis
VVPSRDRHELLRNCIEGIAGCRQQQSFEVVIVDDGSQPPVDARTLPRDSHALVVRLEGVGPAAARNAGIRAARGEIVLFTDDDTVPHPTWVEAALNYLDSHAGAVGVRGPIESVAWDPLYQQSIQTSSADEDIGGNFWTCNIGYRRTTLEAIGGFRADVFRHAHAEDRDLAIRAMELGRIGFAPGMAVSHTPRPVGLRNVIREAFWTRDDVALYALHPQLTADFGLPVKLALVTQAGTRWLRRARESDSGLSVKRWGRAVTLSAVATTVAGWAVFVAPPLRLQRPGRGSGGS